MVAGRIGPAQAPGKPVGVSVDGAAANHEAIRSARTEPHTGPHPRPGLSATQAAVAHAVVNYGGMGSGWCFVSAVTLALDLKVSDRAVYAALAALDAKGWVSTTLRVVRDSFGNQTTATVEAYRLTPVLGDVMTKAERDAICNAAREAAAERKACSREKTAAGCHTPTFSDSHERASAAAERRSAEYPDPDPTESAHLDLDALPDPEGVALPRGGGATRVAVGVPAIATSPPAGPRRRQRRGQVAPPPAGTIEVLTMTLPDPLPPGLHVAYAGVIAAMLEEQLPGIHHSHALTIATRCALHSMEPAQIGWAILRTREVHLVDANIRHLEAVIQRGHFMMASDWDRGRRFFNGARDRAGYDVDVPPRPEDGNGHGVWGRVADVSEG